MKKLSYLIYHLFTFLMLISIANMNANTMNDIAISANQTDQTAITQADIINVSNTNETTDNATRKVKSTDISVFDKIHQKNCLMENPIYSRKI